MKKTKIITALCALTVALLLGIFALPTEAKAATSGDFTYTVSDGKATITDYTGSATNLTIPSELDGYPVTSIGDRAFYNCEPLTSVTIPDSVTSIGSWAFSGCTSLTSVYITDVAAWCGISFGDYGEANPLFFAENLYLNGTLVTELVIPDGVTSIGDNAFYNYRALTSVTIGDSVESIGEWAFYNCSALTSVTIPDSVTSIGNYAFYCCGSLTSVTIPSSVKIIGGTAFARCGLRNVAISDGVIRIGPGVFAGCICLTSVTIPDSVTHIGDTAFQYCISLTSVTIPVSVKNISRGVFLDCESLTDVYYTGTQSQWESVNIEDYNDPLFFATIHYVHAHEYSKEPVATVEATCTEAGYNEYVCVCGDIYRQVLRPALGHDYTANPATCGNCGYVRADVTINSVVLRPTCSGLYFKGAFTFGAQETVTRYGIAASLYNRLPVADDSDETSLYTIGNNSVLISNILNSGNGKELIYARPYVLLENGTYIYGDVTVTNLQSVAETIDTKWSSLTADQQKALRNMYETHSTVTSAWNIPNYQAAVAPCPCGCGEPAADVVWQDANAYISGNGKPVSGFNADGHYRLSADLDITTIFGTAKQMAVGKSTACAVVIDLNGYTWSSNHRLYIYAGSMVTIMDSSAKGTGVLASTGSSGSGRTIINNGTLNLRSGTLTMIEEGATSITTGGVVYQSVGEFNMYGGKIIGGRADTDAGKGGNVNIRKGAFNMYGGEISGGTAAQGANIYIGSNGAFNMYGGTVEDMEHTVYQEQ